MTANRDGLGNLWMEPRAHRLSGCTHTHTFAEKYTRSFFFLSFNACGLLSRWKVFRVLSDLRQSNEQENFPTASFITTLGTPTISLAGQA